MGTNGFVSTIAWNITDLQDGSYPGIEENGFTSDITIIVTKTGMDFLVKEIHKFFSTLQPRLG
jgi:hypothetical protein